MSHLLRSEFLKLRTTRTTRRLLVATLLLVGLIAVGTVLAHSASSLADRETQGRLLLLGGIATVFAALAGALAMTVEFRHGTIRPTLLVWPRRGHVVAAKVVAAAAAGAVFGLAGSGLAAGVLYGGLASKDVAVSVDGGDVLLHVLGITVACALWAGIGAGLGAAIRSQVGALVGLLVWIFVAESILFGLVPRVGRFAPGIASQALSGESARHLLSPLAGGAVLAVYLVLAAAVGSALVARRDV